MVPLTIALPPADVLDSEPKLAAPLAIERKIEPLPDLLREIGRATGVTLTVGPDLKALKATVLTAARPTRDTLRALAVTFESEWERTKAGELRLTPTSETVNQREAFVRALARMRRTKSERALNHWALAATIPWGDRTTELRAAERRVAEKLDASTTEQKRAEDWLEALKATDTAWNWAFGKVWGGLSAEARTAFWNGGMVRGSTQARGGVARLPIEMEDATRGRQPEDLAKPLRVFLRYEPRSGDLETYFDSLMGSGTGRGVSPDDPEALKTHPFLVAQRAWVRTDSGSVLRDPGPVTRPDWFGSFGSDSDALAILHRQSGVPIVAEAFRYPRPHGLGAFGQPTLGAALQAGGFGYVRVENGTVHVRPEEFWNRRMVEPPEGPLRALESEPEPTMDRYAECAAAISGPVFSFTPQGPTLSRVDPMPLWRATPGLRVWGLLEAGQRTAAWAGTPVPFATMRRRAQQAAWAAIVDGLFAGAGASDALLARFDGPFDLESAGDLALFVDREGKTSFTFQMWTPADPRGERGKILSTGPLTKLIFGAAANDGVEYLVRSRGMPRPE